MERCCLCQKKRKEIAFHCVTFFTLLSLIGTAMWSYSDHISIKMPLITMLKPELPDCSRTNNSRHPYSMQTVQINKMKEFWFPIPASSVGLAVKEDRHRYVCYTYTGRLGNIMFIYAASYGLAMDYNLTLAVPKNDILFVPFKNIPLPVVNSSKVCKENLKVYKQPRGRIYQDFPVHNEKANVKFVTYLQSWKYFANSFDDLSQQFSWRPNILRKALNIVSSLKSKYYNSTANVTTVAIHVRRGDYIKAKRPSADKTYIEQAKNYFLKRFPNVLFIVATNPDKESQDWCQKNVIDGSGVSTFSGQNDIYVDLAVMSLTDHIIITLGTYGWWGAFLNKGLVVYYDWMPMGHTRYRRQDFFLPWWVGIKSTRKYSPKPSY